jgi:hypothetical protein
MKIQVKVAPGIIVDVEGQKQKDLFKAVASAHEVFGAKNCGLCGSTDILPTWRTVTTVKGKKTETYEYPEYQCQARDDSGRRCGARLALGTINDDTGTLFPIRKLVDGKRPATKAEKEAGNSGTYGPHNGWHRWEKDAPQGDE